MFPVTFTRASAPAQSASPGDRSRPASPAWQGRTAASRAFTKAGARPWRTRCGQWSGAGTVSHRDLL